MVSSTPRPHFTPGKDTIPILQEDGWAPGPVWTGGKYRPHRDSIPDRPARSQSLYRLSYLAYYSTITSTNSLPFGQRAWPDVTTVVSFYKPEGDSASGRHCSFMCLTYSRVTSRTTDKSCYKRTEVHYAK